MKWSKWLENWDMSSLKIKASFLEAEWKPQTADQDAAWEMYIELLTRITTQPLPNRDGDEKTALASIHALFGITRKIIRRHGRDCNEFTKIAIVVLNQVVRPFTAKWHKRSLDNTFDDEAECAHFRKDLGELQNVLKNYSRMLAHMAGVEDLTELEKAESL